MLQCYTGLKPRVLCDHSAEHRCMCFPETYPKVLSNEFFDYLKIVSVCVMSEKSFPL